MSAVAAVAQPDIANVESEAGLLGALMSVAGQGLIDPVADIVAPEDFFEPIHGRIFELILQFHAEGRMASPVTLRPMLEGDPAISEVGGLGYLAQLTGSGAEIIGVRDFAREVADCAKRRRLIESLRGIIGEAARATTPIDKLIEAADTAMNDALQRKTSIQTVTIAQAFDTTLQAIEDEAAGKGPQGIKIAGLEDFNELTGDLRRGELMYLGGRPSMGKAQPLDALVLTTSGWVEMGDIKVGDQLASVDGEDSFVVGTFPQGQKQIYRVTFSDGRSTECCGEHLWKVRYRDWSEDRVLSADKLREMLGRARYKGRLSIDRFAGEWGERRNFPVDPWLLGVLIGDGNLCSGSVRFSTKDDEILQRVIASVPGDLRVVPAGGCDYRISAGYKTRRPNVLKDTLNELGLIGSHSHDKFIPPQYMDGDRSQRLALLQGLMDTDGWAEKHNVIRFSTASERLAYDVRNLVRSLGGVCSVVSRKVSFTDKGQRREGRTSFMCRIRMDDGAVAFTLPRKIERCTARSKQRTVRLNISSIEPTRIAEAKCIAVSHPSRLYVTDDYIVTHNTALSLNIALGAARAGFGTALLSLEMRTAELTTRAMADLIFQDGGRSPTFKQVRRGQLNERDRELLRLARAQIADWPLIISDPPSLNIGRLAMEIRRQRRRMAVLGQHLDLVIIDYLGLIKGSDKRAKRYEEVGEISRTLKAIAKECDVAIICLAQLNRECERRDDKRPMLSDLRDAGDVEQDADHVMFVYRDQYYLERSEPDAHDKKRADWEANMGFARDRIELIVAKARNGGISKRTCYFFSEYQAVRPSDFMRRHG